MIRTFVFLLALAPSVAFAQNQPLVGAWKVNYPAGMRITNGSPETLMATGSLTITATKDSLLGELVPDPNTEMGNRPQVHLAGKAAAGEVTLVSRSKATINMNGAQEEAVSITTWVIHAKGDSLVGTLARKLEGHDMANQPPTPVTGVRKTR